MVKAIKLMLCDFEKKLAESENGQQEIEQLVIQMEMYIKKAKELQWQS
ncbi:hypothetical protein [Moritella yayanosii]|uniref:Uncharacterized protein n=1 Tax=Moritella yayanosii TaxID=69539 RepID=A0A330LWK1_9GAMM|nr:hypothetical protein [Moritella yayanosii]SQD80341.1 conserved protein of unknown function [Moritella yayanosii]